MEDATAEEDKEPPRPKRKATTTKAATKEADDDSSSNKIPEGKPNSLKGLKLLFTGTFELDRKTCEATAITYGAKLVKKLPETDFIVLGTRPGQKKVDEIEENGLKTIGIEEFFGMLKGEKGESEPARKKVKK